jgi:ribosomal protein S18 acetylase RimI-like enzyme
MELAQGKPEHAEVAADLLYETDAKLFEYLSSGKRQLLVDLFADEWDRTLSPFNYSFSRVATVEGRVVGLLVGYTHEDHAGLDFSKIGSTATGLPPDFLDNLLNRYSLAEYLFPVVPPGAFYIQNLVVAQSHRKQKVGEHLMLDAFKRAKECGCNSCHLDVDGGTRAVNFYRRLKMNVLVETNVPELAEQGIPTHFRMVRKLE